MAAVVFTVDAESALGHTRIANEAVIEGARRNADVLIPFASIDPAKGRAGVLEARRLVEELGVRGFKFHPSVQAFYPNDPAVYPLYEVLQELGVPALFHSGQTGIGSGLPGGGGIRLKYSNPLHLDDVAVDFPDLTIIIAHPSFPWQDEALAVASHKPRVYIDLSGWSPKYFPPQLVTYANSLLKHKVMFGSDFPLISPDRWLADFERLDHQGRGAAADPQGQRGHRTGPDGFGPADRAEGGVMIGPGIGSWPARRARMNPASVALATDDEELTYARTRGPGGAHRWAPAGARRLPRRPRRLPRTQQHRHLGLLLRHRPDRRDLRLAQHPAGRTRDQLHARRQRQPRARPRSGVRRAGRRRRPGGAGRRARRAGRGPPPAQPRLRRRRRPTVGGPGPGGPRRPRAHPLHLRDHRAARRARC